MRALTLLLVVAFPVRAAELTFADLLARMNAPAISPAAAAAMHDLEAPRMSLPNLRFETSATRADNVDVFAQNVFRTNAMTALLSVDYPLFDGGARAAQARAAKLDAEMFRERVSVSEDERRRQAIEAAAQLYLAQERLRIFSASLDRATKLRERATQLVKLHEITNATAAQWEEEALGAEAQRIELELQRVDAETRVKKLIGDASNETIVMTLNLDDAADSSPSVRLGMARVERARIAADEAAAASRPQLLLSAFGGAAYLGEEHQRYGIYGLRFSVALPMLDAASARRVAAARLEAEATELDARAADEQRERERTARSLEATALQKRIALLTRAVEVETQREASVVRLAGEGLRSDSDVAGAAIERSRRENDLLTARVELWKLMRRR